MSHANQHPYFLYFNTVVHPVFNLQFINENTINFRIKLIYIVFQKGWILLQKEYSISQLGRGKKILLDYVTQDFHSVILTRQLLLFHKIGIIISIFTDEKTEAVSS